jgi:hypothetical protein
VRNGRRWASALALIALMVSGLALVQSMRAVDASTTAIQQTHRSHEALRQVVDRLNAINVAQRRDIDTNTEDVDVCHRRATLLDAAIEAVAKTCPGRFRAPRFLDEQRALERPRRTP